MNNQDTIKIKEKKDEPKSGMLTYLTILVFSYLRVKDLIDYVDLFKK